jgi:choline transport protein
VVRTRLVLYAITKEEFISDHLPQASHLAEEVHSAAKTVPRSMIGIFFVNMVFTIACWLVLCFAMPDTGAALEHISTYPVIYVLEQSMSTKWVTVELVLIVALVLFANVCYITAVSRDLWAFARDNGLPFSPWICKVCDGE